LRFRVVSYAFWQRLVGGTPRTRLDSGRGHDTIVLVGQCAAKQRIDSEVTEEAAVDEQAFRVSLLLLPDLLPEAYVNRVLRVENPERIEPGSSPSTRQ